MKQLPEHGLAMFYSETVSCDLVPLRPLQSRVYYCDKRFHTDALWEQLISDSEYLYVIMSGHALDLYVLTGKSHRRIYHKDVDLPNKHNKGGQSQKRFSRLHDEKVANYVTMALEVVQNQMKAGAYAGYILAGPASLKSQLANRLTSHRHDTDAPLLATVDISYDGDAGFREACTMTAHLIQNQALQEETEHLQRFFDRIAHPTSHLSEVCYGRVEVESALGCNLVSTLLWHDTAITRELRDQCTSLECELIPISNETALGHQFVVGFGGYGAILRYPMDMTLFTHLAQEDDVEYEY